MRETDPRRTPDHLPAPFASSVMDAPSGGGLNGRRTFERSRWDRRSMTRSAVDLDLLTADDGCTLLKVKKNWLYDTIESEAIEATRLGKQLRFHPLTIASYLIERAQAEKRT